MRFIGEIAWKAIDMLNRIRIVSRVFVFLKKHIRGNEFKIDSLKIIEPKKSENQNSRYTIILPTIRKAKIFGGVQTALDFFIGLFENTDADARIIILSNESYDKRLAIEIEGFSTENEHRQLLFLRSSIQVEIRKNDYFIFTTWRSAFIFINVFNWQKETYMLDNRKAIYLIQDFESGFYAWSTPYMLSYSTYLTSNDSIIAVFNSKELYDYFKSRGCFFAEELYFRPILNINLKTRLFVGKNSSARKKQILIYGRPNEDRNAFELIRYSLGIWSEKYPDASEWEIFSLGAPGKNIRLRHNTIVVKGKVSIEEYAELMLSSFAGISLMISPHPSYPPMEMSTFGVKTITNKFENKDLSGFNDNIYSIDRCTPNEICSYLINICEMYKLNSSGTISINEEYVNGNSFSEAIINAKKYIAELF